MYLSKAVDAMADDEHGSEISRLRVDVDRLLAQARR
jgi:hypothetical protein